jgi:hypothetical protein
VCASLMNIQKGEGFTVRFASRLVYVIIEHEDRVLFSDFVSRRKSRLDSDLTIVTRLFRKKRRATKDLNKSLIINLGTYICIRKSHK